MISASRRDTLKGAVALSAVTGLPGAALARGESVLLLHDPSLAAGRRLAQVQGVEALAIEGDRIRFARAVFERRPSLVIGVSRAADALLIEEVGREAGYAPAGAGANTLRATIADAQPRDRGRVLGWVLAPRS